MFLVSLARSLALSGLERQTVAALDDSSGLDAGSSVNQGECDLP